MYELLLSPTSALSSRLGLSPKYWLDNLRSINDKFASVISEYLGASLQYPKERPPIPY